MFGQIGVEEIGAVIGALYIIARVIVYLTPTPRDDEQLKRVSVWLKAISTATGLDLKKGVKKHELK